MRIVKRIPASKKVRKRKLYSKSVRYGVVDKSMARMYSDLEKEIFLIERKLENLKYKVRYYSIWSKLTSVFQKLKDGVVNVGKYLSEIYRIVVGKIKSIFKIVRPEYTVNDLIDNNGQLNKQRLGEFIDYLFPSSASESEADIKIDEQMEKLDSKIERLPEKEREEAINAMNLATRQTLKDEFGIDVQNLEVPKPVGAVKTKHESQSDETERNYEIEENMNKLINVLASTKVSLVNKTYRNKLIYLIVSFVVFIVAPVVCYDIMKTFTAIYYTYKNYFLIGFVLSIINFVFSLFVFAKEFEKRTERIEKYKEQFKNNVYILADRINKLNDDNLKAVFAQKLEEASEQIRKLSEKYKEHWYYRGVPESELDKVYEDCFRSIIDYSNSVVAAAIGNQETDSSVDGKSRFRGNRLFSRDRRVMKRKLRYR